MIYAFPQIGNLYTRVPGILGEPIYARIQPSDGKKIRLWPNRLKKFHRSRCTSH